jgi:acetyl esterase/lipase
MKVQKKMDLQKPELSKLAFQAAIFKIQRAKHEIHLKEEKMSKSLRSCLLFIAAITILPGARVPALAQMNEAARWAVQLGNNYRVIPNVVYLTANNYDAKLDLYLPKNAQSPVPTLMHIHGGGWVGGMKESDLPNFLPYLEMGMAVVNIEYRLGRISPAPAAVEDCRCALRWIYQNAKQYNFDTTKIVVTGFSAGGHLSLATGMIPASAGLDRQCSPWGEYSVAAVVNWYGITDVVDLLDGPNIKTYAVNWLGSLPNREEVARRVSPLEYVRAGLPPIMTIHGDADPTVPYSHAKRLHEALGKANVPNQLYTVPGGKHGGFAPDEMVRIHTAIREFLRKYKIWDGTSTLQKAAQ